MKILYVDDDPIMLRSVARVLRAHAVTTSTIPVDPAGFDVALLDCDPHGDAMHRACHVTKTPHVFVTGNYPKALDLVTAGDHALTKPFLNDDLIAALEKAHA